MWAQFLGSSVNLTIAQNIFVSLVRNALHKYAPTVDASAAIEAGATAFAASVSGDVRPGVLKAYNHAIINVFYLGLTLSAAALLAAFGVSRDQVDAKAAMKKSSDADGPKPADEDVTDETGKRA